jgi:hypothetical protein
VAVRGTRKGHVTVGVLQQYRQVPITRQFLRSASSCIARLREWHTTVP